MSRRANACPFGVRASKTGSPKSISRRNAPGFSDDDSAAMYQRFFRKLVSSATPAAPAVIPGEPCAARRGKGIHLRPKNLLPETDSLPLASFAKAQDGSAGNDSYRGSSLPLKEAQSPPPCGEVEM